MVPAERDFAIVLTTAGSDEQARTIARALVARRLAACVNVVTGVHSVYRWKGELAEDQEHLLVIKTRARLFDEIRSAIRSLHSYELPEIVLLPLEAGDPDYLDWIAACLLPEPSDPA